MNSSTQAVRELFSLATDNMYAMAKLEWWLLKHGKLYKNLAVKRRFDTKTGHTYYNDEDKKFPDQVCFLKNYYRADKMSIFHRYEDKLRQVIKEYKAIEFDYYKSEAWVKKYYPVWDKKYHWFLWEHIGEEDNTKLRFSLLDIEQKNILHYIYKDDFKNTIAFIELYFEVYHASDFSREAYEEDMRQRNIN